MKECSELYRSSRVSTDTKKTHAAVGAMRLSATHVSADTPERNDK